MIPYTMFWKSNGPQIHPKKTLLNSVQKKTCDKTIINMKIIQLAAKQGGRKKLNIIWIESMNPMRRIPKQIENKYEMHRNKPWKKLNSTVMTKNKHTG